MLTNVQGFPKMFRDIHYITQIVSEAVRKAIEENDRLGIPSVGIEGDQYVWKLRGKIIKTKPLEEHYRKQKD